ncbi:hypothetical protein FHR47_001545 [Xanthomonas arboricola]|uniref:hypothetical protein n=1 Tax=Xanthomonas cannabis TaxID=1885674 RepID=UPI0017BBBD4F|nr:hypothetical protein [Xanthomonas cannabis]MBB3801311.1 hypothetical protein [Xanthomonas cannabis]
MSVAIFRLYVSAATAVVVAMFAGCAMTESPISKEQFSEHVVALLAGKTRLWLKPAS